MPTWKYNGNLRTEKNWSAAWEQKIGLPTRSGTGAMGPLSRSLRPLFNHPVALRPIEHRRLPQCVPPQQRWFSGTIGWGSGHSLLLPILYIKGRCGVTPFRTNLQCRTYFDQSCFGKLTNLQALQVHESKLIVQTFPKKGMGTFWIFRFSLHVPFWCGIHVCPSYYFIMLSHNEIKSHLLADKVILWAVRDNNKKQKNTWSCNVQFRKWRRRKKFLIFAKRDVHILRGRRTHPAPILSLEYSELTSNWIFLANTIL